MKVCRTCRQEKPLDQFWVQRGRPFYECKACAKARNSAWTAANRDSTRSRNAVNVAASRQAKTPAQAALYSARARAKARGMDFTITEADVVVPEFCPILGIKLISGLGWRGRGGFYDEAPSIDRIDNAKGYVPGNIVVVSGRANRIKSNASPSELMAIALFYGGEYASD